MKFRTLSIVTGSLACNAKCAFCVARMTPAFGLGAREPEVDWLKFRHACLLAKKGEVSTVMLTGNGEPTLFPNQITSYLKALQEFDFPNVELQTNGIAIAEGRLVTADLLRQWRALGLKTIAISIVHYEAEKNRQIFLPHRKKYIDLPVLIRLLRSEGFAVRLTCILASGFIDSAAELKSLLDFARTHDVQQVTATPVNKPKDSTLDPEAYRWTSEHHLTASQFDEILRFLRDNGTPVMVMPHGARVYDLNGQNFCLSNCLTEDPPEALERRNLIFFPSGRLTTDWENESSEL